MSVTLDDDEAQQQAANTQDEILSYLKVIALALCEQQELDLEQLLDDLEDN
jgi:hypothetical protein